MNFGQALELLKAGGRARRTGWNGKGMWIPLTPGTSFPPTLARAGAAEHVARHERGGIKGRKSDPISVGSHIDMFAADRTLVIGWLASQTDMLAEDWEAVSDDPYAEMVQPASKPDHECG